MNLPTLSQHNDIPMFPKTSSEYIEQLNKIKEFLEVYGKRCVEPLGFYNMMLRTKQKNYDIPQYEIDLIIPNYPAINDIYEDFMNMIHDAIGLAKTTQITIEENDINTIVTIVTDEIINNFIIITKRFLRVYSTYIYLFPQIIIRHNFMEKYNGQYFTILKRVQKQSESKQYSLDQLLELIAQHPKNFAIAFRRLFDSIHTSYNRWNDIYDIMQLIDNLKKKSELLFKNLNEHKIIAQIKNDINFKEGIQLEDIYDENRRLIKFIDATIINIQIFDLSGIEIEQQIFEPKESKEVRFFIFNDSIIMTTPPKRNIYNIVLRTALKGILFKKKFDLTLCTVNERLDNRENNTFSIDFVENSQQKTFMTINFNNDLELQQFLQNFSSSKIEFSKTQCFGIMPDIYFLRVKNEKGRIIPKFLSYCKYIIETRGLFEEGIFRISSESKNINKIISLIDSGQSYFEINNNHDAANLMKTYLRTLPKSIAGDKLEQLLEAYQSNNPLEEIKKILNEMPKTHVAIIYIFILTLIEVEKKKEINKMSIDNLCIVVSPTFFWKKGEIQKQNGFEIVQFMLNNLNVFDCIKNQVDLEISNDLDKIKKEELRNIEKRNITFNEAVEAENKRLGKGSKELSLDEIRKMKLMEILEKERKEREIINLKRKIEREKKEKEEEERKKKIDEEMEIERLLAIERQKEIDKLEEEELKAKIEREKKRALIDEEMAQLEFQQKQLLIDQEKLKNEELINLNNQLKLQEDQLKKNKEFQKNLSTIIGICSVCNINVFDTEDSLSAGKRLVHDRCFVCKSCKQKITSKFVWRDDAFICNDCINKANDNINVGNNCAKCSKIIEGKIIKAMGKIWHADCFICAKCNGKISSGFVNWDGKPVCKNCKDSI